MITIKIFIVHIHLYQTHRYTEKWRDTQGCVPLNPLFILCIYHCTVSPTLPCCDFSVSLTLPEPSISTCPDVGCGKFLSVGGELVGRRNIVQNQQHNILQKWLSTVDNMTIITFYLTIDYHICCLSAYSANTSFLQYIMLFTLDNIPIL